jgi:hypothetical protein
MPDASFTNLRALAKHLRDVLGQKIQRKPDKSPFVLIYAFNGTGKTRLSGAYRNLGRTVNADGETTKRDTLYFNAYTEDLFSWDNDLENEREPVLELNDESKFFDGLREVELEVRIGELLARYADFNFRIDYDRRKPPESPDTKERVLPPAVTFYRELSANGDPIPIKVSRGEENIFIWCFFLAILQLALDGDPAYAWVEHVYIDDPISSLDEHNAIVAGNHLIQLYCEAKRPIRTIVSTHHTLFFNVLHYELTSHVGGPVQYVLKQDRNTNGYLLREQKGDTPQFYHVSALVDLCELARQGKISTYHFNVLRSVLEKTAFFLGYKHFSNCLKKGPDDADGILHQRFVDILSHGKYSMYEPIEMGEETQNYFLTILKGFVDRHPFNPELVRELPEPKSNS